MDLPAATSAAVAAAARRQQQQWQSLQQRGNPADDWELVQRVGSGTFGEVYKAKHIRTGELSAIKEVKLGHGDDFSIIQQEILMLAECSHPNIIAYHGSYYRRDRLWIVMEYCGGGSLQDIYTMSGVPLEELQIGYVCRETLHGLAYLHSLGKIHRDVKGANILLTTNGDVKLADFGVAARISATIAKRKSFIGTPYWMAPEVAAVERKGGYNELCDVWAVGITAVELAERQPPHFDLHPMRLLAAMAKSSYKSPSLTERNRWSPSFHEFVKRCLTKSVRKRPTCDQLLQTCAFVQQPSLSSRLGRDLLDRVNNPQRHLPPRDGPLPGEETAPSASQQRDAPQRIPSRQPADFHLTSEQLSRIIRPISVANVEGLSPWRRANNQQNNSHDDHPGQGGERSYSSQRTLPKDQTPPDLLCGLSLADPPGALQSDDDDTQPGGNVQSGSGDASANTLGREGNGGRDDTLTRFYTADREQMSSPEGQPFEATPDGSSDSESYVPPVAPGRASKLTARQHVQPQHGDADRVTFGLPPTPKVPMGACFSKIFHGCPLRLNAACSWTADSGEQYVLLGAEEGIYALNLNLLHEATLERMHPRRCSWLYPVKHVLMAVQGRTPHVYRHELPALLHAGKLASRLSATMAKVPDRLVPRKLAVSTKISHTKCCLRCCVQRNPFTGALYLCCLLPTGVLLMQWYDPLAKFMVIKQVECAVALPVNVFELLTIPNHEYPIVCCGVAKGQSRKLLHFDTIDLNTGKRHVHSDAPGQARHGAALNVTALRQIAPQVVVVCFNNKVRVTNLYGRIKSSRLAPAELSFDWRVDALVCLSDSVLAFHRHGVQGRAFIDDQLTQDLHDPNHVYRLLGTEKAIVLECRPVRSPNQGFDLCILTGHESTLT